MTTAHLTVRSRNTKTGPIPVSTSHKSSCPSTCPFIGAGCYAEAGPLALFWSKVNNGSTGTDWNTFCDSVAALPEGQLWRHNQAGDLPGMNTSIDAEKLALLVRANGGKRGFTFTHKPVSPAYGGNADAIRDANTAGFTINLSADNLHHADELAALGIAPVVVVLPHDVDGAATHTLKTPEGRTVSVCPATYREDTTCQTCELCQHQDRACIVGFPAHGSSRRKASRIASRSLPDVSSRFGAPMGRAERHGGGTHKVSLRRVRVNRGGYDAGGAYWGIGQPLYWYANEDDTVSAFLRAADREEAKASIRAKYPAATFYR